MEIAADGRFQRVEIGMGVKPEHKERPAALDRAPRDPRDHSCRGRAVSTAEDRQAVVAVLIRCGRKKLDPCHRFSRAMDRGVGVSDGVNVKPQTDAV